MPPLKEADFSTLAEAGAPAMASALLARHNGVARKAERDLWDTWQIIVGGEPGNRTEAGLKNETAQFLVTVITCMVEGTEEPKVARVDPHQRLAA